MKALTQKIPRNEGLKLFVVIVPTIVAGIIMAEFIEHLDHLRTSNSIVDTFMIAFLLGSIFALGTTACINYYLFHRMRRAVLDHIKLNQNNNFPQVTTAEIYQPVPSVAERSLNRMRFKLKKTTKERIVFGILAVGVGIFAPILQNHGYLSPRYCFILEGISGFFTGLGVASSVLLPMFKISFAAKWKRFMTENQDIMQFAGHIDKQTGLTTETLSSQAISTPDQINLQGIQQTD